MFFAVFYPIILSSFKEKIQPIHLGLSIVIHLILAMFGIIVGSFSSIFSFVTKKYTWLLAVLVIVVTISYEGIVEKLDILKWFFVPFPPVVNIINFFVKDDLQYFGIEFWIYSAFGCVYSIIAFNVLIYLFLKKES
jgi:hypothetical protein